MSKDIRCFIALDITNQLKMHIADIQSNISTKIKGIRFVKPDNIHITIKFLGEKSSKSIKLIIETLNHLDIPKDPITIHIDKLGVFPNNRNPRIIWLGFRRNGVIEGLYSSIDNKLALLGMRKENRPLNPHLTLGRLKSLNNGNLIIESLIHDLKIEPFEEIVRSLTLYKSTLSSDGPHYEALLKREFN